MMSARLWEWLRRVNLAAGVAPLVLLGAWGMVPSVQAQTTLSSSAPSIGVGSSPFAMAVNPVTGQVYVANNSSGTVSVINGATNMVAAPVPVGTDPRAVAVNAVTGYVYVANFGSNNVSVIDGATNTVTTTIPVGTQPQAVAVNAVTGKVYVANSGSNSVSVIDGATNTVTTTVPVPVGSYPDAVAVNAVTGKVYVANEFGNNVSVIDGATNTIAAAVPVGLIPDAVAVNAVTGQVYVTNNGTENVSVIDGATNTVTATVPVGTNPAAVAVNAVTGQVYVANEDSNNVSVIDGATNTVTATVTVGSTPDGVAVNAVTGQVYVANQDSDNVSVIDGAGNTVAATISVGTERGGLAENAVTGQVYVTNQDSNNVSVIDGQGTQGVPIGITAQASATVPSPYSSSAATAAIPYITTYPAPSFTATATSSYTTSTVYSGIASAVNPPLTALYYWLDDGSMSSWQYVAPSSTAGSNPATFPIALSGKKPGFYMLYMFAAYGNEGTPWSTVNGTGNSPEISEVTAYPFYLSPIATTTVVQADVNPQGVNQNVTLTTIVTPAAAGAVATPTGTVNFYDGTTLLNATPVSIAPVSGSNEASFQTSFSTTGSQSITAVFTPGDQNYFGSTSAALTETITGPPTVTGISPTSGPATGGTAVTITGTSFTGATSVSFGGAPAMSFTVISATTITATSPAGTGTVDVVVTNSNASAPSAADRFTYIQPLTLSSATLPAATAETAYSQTVTASGGTPPYTYAVTGGALPAGLSLSSGGVISGTPTASGSFSFTVTVTDSSGSKVTASYTLTVNAGTATLTFAAVPAQTYGNPPFMVSARSASTGAITYSVVSGPATVVASTGVVTLMGAGAVTIEASQAAAAGYNSATAMTTIQAAKQATQTSVSASPTVATPVQTVTLTATVAATVAGTPATPTGTVIFLDNGVQLGAAVNVVGGIATLVVPSLPAGTAVITATYAGDGNFVGSMSNNSASVVVSLFGFTFTNTGTAAYTAVPGAMATYNFALAPLSGSYPGPVSFSVTGLPTGATASFTPGSVAVGGGATPVVMTVQTASATAQNKSNSPFGRGIVLAFLLLPLVAKRSVREKMKGRMLLLLLLMAGVTATLTGCGSTNGFLLQSPQTYTLTVTATSGTLAHSETVTLIVQ